MVITLSQTVLRNAVESVDIVDYPSFEGRERERMTTV